jgi:predicted DsbA family dithiol-disulfide isomerase
MDTEKGAAKIRKDLADSEKAGAKGTPIFFLGLTEPNSSELKAVRVIRGAHPYSAFKEAIDSLLASAK